MVKLDRSRPFSEVYGSFGHRYEQDGQRFDQAGKPVADVPETAADPEAIDEHKELLRTTDEAVRETLERCNSRLQEHCEEFDRRLGLKEAELNDLIEKGNAMLKMLEKINEDMIADKGAEEPQEMLFDNKN